jgi:hypothetical protein
MSGLPGIDDTLTLNTSPSRRSSARSSSSQRVFRAVLRAIALLEATDDDFRVRKLGVVRRRMTLEESRLLVTLGDAANRPAALASPRVFGVITDKSVELFGH